jgi:hypothetical protein
VTLCPETAKIFKPRDKACGRTSVSKSYMLLRKDEYTCWTSHKLAVIDADVELMGHFRRLELEAERTVEEEWGQRLEPARRKANVVVVRLHKLDKNVPCEIVGVKEVAGKSEIAIAVISHTGVFGIEELLAWATRPVAAVEILGSFMVNARGLEIHPFWIVYGELRALHNVFIYHVA